MKIFESVADLKLARLGTGQLVKTKGYYTANDGGGAEYIIVTSGTGTDDGGSYLDLALNQAELIHSGIVNIKQYGAVLNTDVSAIYTAMLLNTTIVKITSSGAYLWSATVNARSNLEIDGLNSTVFTMASGLLTQAIIGTSVDDVVLRGFTMTTTQEAPSGGLQRFIQAFGCKRFHCYDLYLDKCKNQPITYDGCSYSSITRIHSQNCYGSAFTFRNNCFMCTASDLYANQNGILSGAISSTGGRGLLIWQSSKITVANVVIDESTEYGIRIYSQADDSFDTKDITLTNISIRNSGVIDYYIYNESGRVSNIVTSNLNIRTVGTSKIAIALQGSEIALNNAVLESENPQQNVAINLFSLDEALISNLVVKNFASLVAYGSSALATNTTITDVKATGLLQITNSILGAGNSIKNSKFYFHNTSSVFAIGLTDVVTEISNNYFDGAYRVLEFVNSPSIITGNTAVNTKNVSLRKYGTSLTGMKIYGNSWDIGSNPLEFGRISELNCHGQPSHCVLITNAIPTVLTYPIRSIAYSYDNTALSTHIGWTQISAGTWRTFGDITP